MNNLRNVSIIILSSCNFVQLVAEKTVLTRVFGQFVNVLEREYTITWNILFYIFRLLALVIFFVCRSDPFLFCFTFKKYLKDRHLNILLCSADARCIGNQNLSLAPQPLGQLNVAANHFSEFKHFSNRIYCERHLSLKLWIDLFFWCRLLY